jgi:hypothetical protein
VDSEASVKEKRRKLLLARQLDLTREKLRAAYKKSKLERKQLSNKSGNLS